MSNYTSFPPYSTGANTTGRPSSNFSPMSLTSDIGKAVNSTAGSVASGIRAFFSDEEIIARELGVYKLVELTFCIIGVQFFRGYYEVGYLENSQNQLQSYQLGNSLVMALLVFAVYEFQPNIYLSLEQVWFQAFGYILLMFFRPAPKSNEQIEGEKKDKMKSRAYFGLWVLLCALVVTLFMTGGRIAGSALAYYLTPSAAAAYPVLDYSDYSVTQLGMFEVVFVMTQLMVWSWKKYEWTEFKYRNWIRMSYDPATRPVRSDSNTNMVVNSLMSMNLGSVMGMTTFLVNMTFYKQIGYQTDVMTAYVIGVITGQAMGLLVRFVGFVIAIGISVGLWVIMFIWMHKTSEPEKTVKAAGYTA